MNHLGAAHTIGAQFCSEGGLLMMDQESRPHNVLSTNRGKSKSFNTSTVANVTLQAHDQIISRRFLHCYSFHMPET